MRRPVIKLRDIALVGLLPGTAAIAWSVPERHWEKIARVFLRINRENRGRTRTDRVGHIARVVGEKNFSLAPEACLRANIANRYLERLQLLRCYHPSGWHPRIRFQGREHIDAALSAGHGAILWITPFIFSDLVTKIALHREGFAVSHLSRVTHNISSSLFGERVLNPIRTTIECRNLAERIVIGAESGNSAGARARLRQRLEENRLISIAVGAAARRVCAVPFMSGTLRLATGPLYMALQSSAPLLPVFTVRQPDGSFVTTVAPALKLPDGRDMDKAMREALLEYVALLEPNVTRYPDQFRWETKGVESHGPNHVAVSHD